MSNGIALVLAIGLVAALFALVIVVLRRSPGHQPASPAAELTRPQDDEQRELELAEASREAAQIRARAEADAAAIVSRAEAATEQSVQARHEVENEIRAVKEEVKHLRSDLERREARLAEREQRIDSEARKVDERSGELDGVQQGIDRQRAELEQLDERPPMRVHVWQDPSISEAPELVQA